MEGVALIWASMELFVMKTHFEDENAFSSFWWLFELRFQLWVAHPWCIILMNFELIWSSFTR